MTAIFIDERLHFRAGPGDVAGGLWPGPQLAQLRRHAVALVDRERAAPAEPAAGRRVDHLRRLAPVGLAPTWSGARGSGTADSSSWV